MSLLWMPIEPRETETRLQLSEGGGELCLRARLLRISTSISIRSGW